MVAANKIWPAATDQSSISNNYKANTVEPDNNHQFDVKADYQITEKDRFFGRESYQRRDLSAPSPGTRASSRSAMSTPRHAITTLRWVTTIPFHQGC